MNKIKEILEKAKKEELFDNYKKMTNGYRMIKKFNNGLIFKVYVPFDEIEHQLEAELSGVSCLPWDEVIQK